ncbi:hypothetical protein F4778DRAFT_758880 [Xylariomycetidae sp. FL2044]|nr:hypothetical protein F4778DRAFT_758880 [Xylariomycetidae sp. FL2044]
MFGGILVSSSFFLSFLFQNCPFHPLLTLAPPLLRSLIPSSSLHLSSFIPPMTPAKSSIFSLNLDMMRINNNNLSSISFNSPMRALTRSFFHLGLHLVYGFSVRRRRRSRLGLSRLGLSCLGLSRLGLDRLGLDRLGLDRLGWDHPLI